MTRFLMFAVILSLSVVADAQRITSLAPARGHYKQLSEFSGAPRSANLEIDERKFITAKATIERRLELKPVYLRNKTIDDFEIPNVPANSSALTKAEIEYLLALQQTRTAEDIRASHYMANIYYNIRVTPADSTYARFRRNIFHIGRSIGTWFNPDNLPLTAEMMASVWRDASYFIWSFKFKYARIRPVAIDSRINNLEVTDWAAYPSGHAANSYINAFIYQELAPEFADIFIKDAYDMAHSREILGVHFPSDSESSRIFARQFVNMLFQNERFLADLKAVKDEWYRKAKEDLSGSGDHH